MKKAVDMTGNLLGEGALVAMPTKYGSRVVNVFRVVTKVYPNGHVRVRGVGGPENPSSKPATVQNVSSLVTLEPYWAYLWEGIAVDAAETLVAGWGMAAPQKANAVDVEEFIADLSDKPDSEPEFFVGAVKQIIHNAAMNEWHRGYKAKEV